MARGLDDLYHQANTRVATITGTTTTSMIAVVLMRRRRSADAIGPLGSKSPPEQPPSVATESKTRAGMLYRMLHLVRCADGDNRQRGYARPGILVATIERQRPEMGRRPQEDDQEQDERLKLDPPGCRRPADHGWAGSAAYNDV